MTLEEIINAEQKTAKKRGVFGLDACKDCIKHDKEVLNKSFYVQLERYVERANNEGSFNRTMVLACWELINDK